MVKSFEQTEDLIFEAIEFIAILNSVVLKTESYGTPLKEECSWDLNSASNSLQAFESPLSYPMWTFLKFVEYLPPYDIYQQIEQSFL